MNGPLFIRPLTSIRVSVFFGSSLQLEVILVGIKTKTKVRAFNYTSLTVGPLTVRSLHGGTSCVVGSALQYTIGEMIGGVKLPPFAQPGRNCTISKGTTDRDVSHEPLSHFFQLLITQNTERR